MVGKKSLTIWIAPDISRKVRSITLNHTFIKLTILAFLVGSISISSLFLTFAARYKAMKEKVIALKGLEEENKKQKEQINYFSENLKGLEEKVNKLKEFSQKLRIMTSLKPIESSNKTNSKYGMGGPIDVTEDSWERPPPPDLFLKGKKNDVAASIEDLRTQILIEEESFQEIEELLKRQKNLLLCTPSIWPVKGWVASGFGKRVSPFTGKIERHKGIDIQARPGTPVRAPANGVISKVGRMRGLGNYITINHGYGFVTRFGHNKKNLVKKGERVKRGQVIAQVGNTGRTTGPHLHYEVLTKGKYVNPRHYILD